MKVDYMSDGYSLIKHSQCVSVSDVSTVGPSGASAPPTQFQF